MRCARVSYLKRQGQFAGLRERRLGHLELPYMGRALRTKDPVRYLLAVSFDKNRQLRRRLGYHAIANYKSSRNRTNGRVLKLHLHLQLLDRKSTRLNSSHGYISYAVFCLKKKK